MDKKQALKKLEAVNVWLSTEGPKLSEADRAELRTMVNVLAARVTS